MSIEVTRLYTVSDLFSSWVYNSSSSIPPHNFRRRITSSLRQASCKPLTFYGGLGGTSKPEQDDIVAQVVGDWIAEPAFLDTLYDGILGSTPRAPHLRKF
jgi:hypothetical protein